MIRKFYQWLDAGNQNGSGPSGSKSSTGNGRRGYSTSAVAGRSSQATPLSKVRPRFRSKWSKKLSALKVVGTTKIGNFFKVIAKRGALVSLAGGKATKGLPTLSNLLSRLGFRIVRAVFCYGGKYLSRLRQLNAFHVHVLNKRRHHGDVFVVKYLKVSQLATQKAIAGTPVDSLRQLEPALPLPWVTNQGFPKWIPIRDRRLMIAGSSGIIRWYLTLFAVYRVIYIPGTLKLGTITEPCSVSFNRVQAIIREVVLLVPKDMIAHTLFQQPKAAYKVGVEALPHIPFLESASSTQKVA